MRNGKGDIGFIANMQIYYLIIDLWNWFGSALADERIHWLERK